MKQLKSIAPDYPRIAHLCKGISNMTEDDIVSLQSANEIPLPLNCFVQEKLDAANMGVSWLDAPILRNRDHVLQKGYSKIRTPAKQQFQPAWNWVHAHEDDIREVGKLLESQITIYGEWMWAQHSLAYDLLPDWFIAYDIWSVSDKKFVAPNILEQLLSQTSIKFIKPYSVSLQSVADIVLWSEKPSEYRNGVREGIVIKTARNAFCEDSFKVVNNLFVRRDDFNDVPLVKNTLAGK